MTAGSVDLRDFMIPARFVVRQQRWHVVLCNVLPLLGTALAIALIPFWQPGWVEVSLAVAMWALTLGVGGTVGFHRYFTHRSFDTGHYIRCGLAILGSMTASGPLIAWVVTHRRHHERSDADGDPHSPNLHGTGILNCLRGLWHAHAGWLYEHDLPDPMHYAPDLMSDRSIVWINRHYYRWVILGIVIPALIGGLIFQTWFGLLASLLWGGLVRLFVSTQIIWSINSVCHMLGHRRYATADSSRNNAWLAIPSFGESWHNNHHAFPTSAAFGHRWWEIDFGWLAICALKATGLIWNVRLPKFKNLGKDETASAAEAEVSVEQRS